jgi:hypothetical protein
MAQRHNPGRHHRQSIRLKGYDYRSAGAYFVTICTRNRECILDDPVISGIISDVWLSLPGWFPTIALDEFVVMPNHVHLIVWLRQVEASPAPTDNGDDGGATLAVDSDMIDHPTGAGASPAPTVGVSPAPTVGVRLALTPTDDAYIAPNVATSWIIPTPQTTILTPTLGEVIGAFKSLVFTVYLDWIEAWDLDRDNPNNSRRLQFPIEVEDYLADVWELMADVAS